MTPKEVIQCIYEECQGANTKIDSQIVMRIEAIINLYMLEVKEKEKDSYNSFEDEVFD